MRNSGGRYSSPSFNMPRQYTQRQIVIGLALVSLVTLLYLYQQTKSLKIALAILIGRVIALVIGFTLHEWAHASTALRLGDYTAYNQGRLTLDPRSHIDPLGLGLGLLTGFGWARPVPVNPHAFYPHERRGMMITALAGPLMNICIAALLGIVFRLSVLALPRFEYEFVDLGYLVLLTVIIFNITLFFFNLLPFSPLDGWKILMGVVDNETSTYLARNEFLSTQLLLLMLMIGFATPALNIIGNVLGPLIDAVLRVFTGV